MRICRVDNSNNMAFNARISLEGSLVKKSVKDAREVASNTAQEVLDRFYCFQPDHEVKFYERNSLEANKHYFTATNINTNQQIAYQPSTYTKTFYKFLERLMDTSDAKIRKFWGIDKAQKNNNSIINHPVFSEK